MHLIGADEVECTYTKMNMVQVLSNGVGEYLVVVDMSCLQGLRVYLLEGTRIVEVLYLCLCICARRMSKNIYVPEWQRENW